MLAALKIENRADSSIKEKNGGDDNHPPLLSVKSNESREPIS
jgi:hypothetical protein